MSDTDRPIRLFDEFSAVSTEAWEARIRADLGDVDFDEQLLWRPTDDLTFRPYYRSENLHGLPHLDPYAEREVTLGSAWSIQQNIRVRHIDDTVRKMRDAAEGGVEILGLDLTGRHVREATRTLAPLTERIDLSATGIHIEAGISSLACLASLLRDGSEPYRSGLPSSPRSVTAAFDPISELVRSGHFAASSMEEAARAIDELPPHVRMLQAGGGVFHEAGADLVDETAFTLAALSEYLSQLVDRGQPSARVLGRLFISVQIGSSYFLEIARLRALRLLVQQVLAAFEAEPTPACVPVHAYVSRRNMTLYDPHSNLLRATTEAASAVIGGCDVLIVHPFDDVERAPSDLACRLARNLQHLLRHEAYMDGVDDPSAGCYYVEVLTDALGRSAWRRFQEIERQGGLLKAFETGTIHEFVSRSRDRLVSDVARRDRVLVGTNWYPDPDERRLDATPDESFSRDLHPLLNEEPQSGNLVGPPLELRRAAETIESLRLRTEHYAKRIGRRPSAGILPCGEPSVRSARAHLAANFLGCAGLEIRTEDGVETAEEALAAATQVDADLLIIAGSNTFYEHDVVHDIRSLNLFVGIGIVATPGTVKGADFLVYAGADLVQTLSVVQNMVGIVT